MLVRAHIYDMIRFVTQLKAFSFGVTEFKYERNPMKTSIAFCSLFGFALSTSDQICIE
jgi:hypothetical protein